MKKFKDVTRCPSCNTRMQGFSAMDSNGKEQTLPEIPDKSLTLCFVCVTVVRYDAEHKCFLRISEQEVEDLLRNDKELKAAVDNAKVAALAYKRRNAGFGLPN